MSIKGPADKRFIVGAVGLAVVGGILLLAVSGGSGRKVARVAHADPELQAASKKAKSELGTFIKELSSPSEGKGFAIKGAFPTPAGPEYLWVKSPLLNKDLFVGVLDQEPLVLSGKHKGDIVVVKKADVYDWLIKDENGIRGMYTEKVLQTRAGR